MFAGIGTLVNFIAMLIGSLIGLTFGKALSERFRQMIISCCALAVIFIGISGAVSGFLTYDGQGFGTQSTLLLVFSLVIGGIIGESLKIEERLDNLGEKLKSILKRGSDVHFVDGFVTASLITCVGAMTVVGPIEDALQGDPTTLFVKSLLDFLIVMILASSLGAGVIFSSLSVGVVQGLFTLCAVFIEPYLTDIMIRDLCAVGSTLITCVGVNLVFGKKFKVGNMTPALIVPVIYHLLLPIFVS